MYVCVCVGDHPVQTVLPFVKPFFENLLSTSREHWFVATTKNNQRIKDTFNRASVLRTVINVVNTNIKTLQGGDVSIFYH